MFTSGFPTLADCERDIGEWCQDKSQERLYYTVLSGAASDPRSEPVGMMCYLAIVPSHRRLEIGSVILSAALQQTRQATEAFYLLIKHAFEDLGYLRVEWKANNLNQPSLRAAARLGFTFEGVFRKHMVIKGRERDTAWFSITDEEWPAVKRGLVEWLRDENFDDAGGQKRGLKECREAM
jgi:RimJ/RimL family protein N-acetyltransferase